MIKVGGAEEEPDSTKESVMNSREKDQGEAGRSEASQRVLTSRGEPDKGSLRD